MLRVQREKVPKSSAQWMPMNWLPKCGMADQPLQHLYDLHSFQDRRQEAGHPQPKHRERIVLCARFTTHIGNAAWTKTTPPPVTGRGNAAEAVTGLTAVTTTTAGH